MKKLLFAFMAVVAFVAVSCSKTEEEGGSTSLVGRWEAPRFAETPEDIAFVAIFGEQDLDLYVIAWGQHMKGTYTYADNVVRYNITEAYNAYTGEEGSMGWNAGNLDAATLTLASGYEWYPMTEENLARAIEDFGEFEFKVDGNTATSSLVGIDNLIFNKVN